jgi:hypothetical protein
MDVFNREALTERFGGWPSFHDAEIYGLRLDSGQRTDGVVRLELDIHLFSVDGVRPDGRLKFSNHTLVTLEFEEVEALDLDEFGNQNVLFELKLEDVNLAAGRQIEVGLSSSHGLSGGFRCRTATVLAVVPMTPGPHSVYRV